LLSCRKGGISWALDAAVPRAMAAIAISALWLTAGIGEGAVAADRVAPIGAGVGGLPKDDREVARLDKLAAGQGNAPAQVNLGDFYENGLAGGT
jgi:TPR repeat protein